MTTVSRAPTPPPDDDSAQLASSDGTAAAADGHPHWCDGHEHPSAPHGIALAGVDAGQVVFSVDLFQHGQQSPTVVLGVYERRRTGRHPLTIDRAADLRDALTTAVDLARPAADGTDCTEDS
jgi:hypothetical protein